MKYRKKNWELPQFEVETEPTHRASFQAIIKSPSAEVVEEFRNDVNELKERWSDYDVCEVTIRETT